MHTAAILSVLAFAAVASANKPGKKKVSIAEVSHHVSHIAEAAEAVGNAVSSFRQRSDDGDLYARFVDELYARALEDDLYARELEDGVYVRELDDELYAREHDDAHWARADFEELFARAAADTDELD